MEEILARWTAFEGLPQVRNLPSAPKPFLRYLEDPPGLSRLWTPMRATGWRFRSAVASDPVMDWKFTCLSHNTLRGAAGGAVLTAELLADQGYNRGKIGAGPERCFERYTSA
jgi:aspartate-semialdehyde dehydrogenase